MTGSLFPQFDAPEPAPAPTTAPLFELPDNAAVPAAAEHGPLPEPPHRPLRDVALFPARLALPDEDADELAFQLTV
ncbi:hypothetical protein [Amycolatopsis keratiniphila]|uniref:Uncharacterized protein n=1 Tax=Amycolatopsis keratiniphila subsp. keratiniphila TaxID=227715 RepID=A0A1W2M250_9PSEU|nr:hypothetical protein [Amycolatopsis keratiniphila]ONF73963.1 hypothetical protein AVR91_0204330 [Amycolatopsis keratiniphila subsp. keratiniphila]